MSALGRVVRSGMGRRRVQTVVVGLVVMIAVTSAVLGGSRKTYGDRNPVVAVNLENLGGVYMRQGEYAKTLALLDEVLAIREASFGKDSAPAARTRFNMGVVASRTGDHARAYESIDAGLKIFREQYGEKSNEAAVGFFYRGVTSEALGRFDDARRDYQSSIAIIDTIAAPTDPNRLNALDHLARLDCNQGDAARGLASVDLGMSALDRSNADHQVWFERFEKARSICGSL
jgi:tetratricopeptide (TPR) repeat protein